MKKSKILEILKKCNSAQRNGTGQFVGAIYDSKSPPGDHEVALVVGINYGQTGTSGGSVGMIEDSINYARYVTKLLTKDCHVVIWNFFPYLTVTEWMQDITNSVDQAERIFDNGYVDPFSVFEYLVENLDLQDHHIIFHGFTSAVPILARIVSRKVGRTCFLVPNLSRGLNPSLAIAIS